MYVFIFLIIIISFLLHFKNIVNKARVTKYKPIYNNLIKTVTKF